MTNRKWLPYAALVGCLIPALSLESLADTPNAQGVAAPSPPVKEQAAHNASSAIQPTEIPPFSIRVIQSEIEAKDAKAREAKTDKHDAEDLDAQVRAAKAAEEQVPPAWVAALLSLLGTVLLVWNLCEARKATQAARRNARAAERAAAITRKNFEKLERPYLFIFGISKFSIDSHVIGGLTPWVTYSVANYGKIPALIKEVWIEFGATDKQIPESQAAIDKSEPLLVEPIFAANEIRDKMILKFKEAVSFLNVEPLAIPDLTNGNNLFCWIRISYEGPFGGDYETSACWQWFYQGREAGFSPSGGEKYNYRT